MTGDSSRQPRPGGAAALHALFDSLLERYGDQRWWPGKSPFEIALGAILVQRTTWNQAAAALERLRSAAELTPGAIAGLPDEVLYSQLRPAGFYRAKSASIRAFCGWLSDAGGFPALDWLPTAEIRSDLLGVKGVGPETADCILLYALGRRVFVIDAYTRRVVARLGLYPEAERADYETLRTWFETRLRPDAALYNEFHALFVAHGKAACWPRPRCGECVVAGLCERGQEVRSATAQDERPKARSPRAQRT